MSNKTKINIKTLNIIKVVVALFVMVSIIEANQSNLVFAEAEEANSYHKSKFQVVSVITSGADEGKFKVVETVSDFNTAKSRMNALHSAKNPHLVTIETTDSKTNELYTKIIAQPAGGFAQSYPYRKGTIGNLSPRNTLLLYTNTALTSDNGYIPGHIQMRVYDVIQYNNSFVADVEVSGQRGFVDINKIDLIPQSHMTDVNGNGGIKLSLGGHEDYYKVPEKSYTMKVKPEYYQVKANGSYNEITFFQYRTYPGMGDSTLTFGVAPNWLPGGIYFSDNQITFFKDLSRKQPVLDGTAQGEYYSYFQWLPVNSVSLHDSSVLTSFLKDVNRTNSVYYNQTQSFIDNGIKYGMNPLLIFAQANLESGYGTSKYAKERNNLFGWKAVDSNPDDAAFFDSVSDSIKLHMSQNLKDYMNPGNWKHFGFSFGNMSSGVSYKYASDPLYGMKIASIALSVDRLNGYKDYNFYQLTKLPDNTVKTFTTEPGSGNTVYKSKSLKNQIVANLGATNGHIKTNLTVSKHSQFLLDLTKDFVYFDGNGITDLVQYGPNGIPPVIYPKGDVNGRDGVTVVDLGMIQAHLLKIKPLQGDMLSRADVNNDGAITVVDLGMVQSHLLKIKPLD